MTTLEDLLKCYHDEELPDFVDIQLTHANQRGRFGDFLLHIACSRGKLDEVAILIQAGADINALGEMNNTPIHAAILGHHTEIVILLLSRGVDLSIRNDFGQTPLELATTLEDIKIAQLIRSALKTNLLEHDLRRAEPS